MKGAKGKAKSSHVNYLSSLVEIGGLNWLIGDGISGHHHPHYG